MFLTDPITKLFSFEAKDQLLWIDIVVMVFMLKSYRPIFRRGHNKRNPALKVLDYREDKEDKEKLTPDVPDIHFTMSTKRKSRYSKGNFNNISYSIYLFNIHK